MPEIWLPYGSVEVAVQLKAENLGEVIGLELAKVEPDVLKERLKELEVEDETLIFLCDCNSSTLHILSLLLAEAKERGVNLSSVELLAPRSSFSVLKSLAQECRVSPSSPSQAIGAVDGAEVIVPYELSKARRKFLISSVGFDPMFGFSGGPVSLLRCLNKGLMREAFIRRAGDLPRVGEETPSSSFALKVSECIDGLFSIEVLSLMNDVIDVFLGDVREAHVQASGALLSIAKKELKDEARTVIASVGGEGQDHSLASSLKALANIKSGLRQNASIALLAECSKGLGSDALHLLLTDRLSLTEALKEDEYVDGLEDLIYLQNILHEHEVILVSSLPHYYVSKLGMRVAKTSSDALEILVKEAGARAKIHIILRAAETLLSKPKAPSY